MAPGRRQIDWGAIGLFGLGVLSTWLAVTGLSPTVGAVSAGAPVVEFRPSSLIPAPLAVSLFALASIALIPRQQYATGRARRGEDKVFWRRAARLLYVAGAGAIVAIAIAPTGQAVMSRMMASRGYERCPDTDPVRRPPLRWHRARSDCPGGPTVEQAI